MASTYVNNLRLDEMGTGDASGTWGNTTNTNLELIGEAMGFGTEGITTNADTHTTTVADGASDAGRSMYLKYTGTLDSACTITIAPNTMKRMQFIENGTSGSQNIIISQGSGANVTIPPGDTKAVYLDGAGSGAAVVDAFASLNVVDLKVEDDLTVTDDLIVNGDIDLEGSIDVNGTLETDAFSINGTSVTATGAELNYSDTGQSVGVVVANKVVTADANKDVASFRNITLTGELDAGSLDVSGNADIDGTLEADAMTLNGTAITTTATLSTGISNGNVLVANASVADNDFLRVDGTSIEGRTSAEVLSDIGASAVAGSGSIVTTGALNSGSITSGFGSIDNGTSTLTTGNSDINGTLNVQGVATFQTHVDLGDSDEVRLGAGVDMKVFSDGTNGVLRADNGSIYLQSDNNVYLTRLGSSETMLQAVANGAVNLYHNNSNKMQTTSAGISVTGTVTASGDITAFSDRRLKTDITNIDNALSKVMQMQGVNYKRNDIEDAPQSIGVIAQDMETILPEVIHTSDDEMQTKSVDYGKICAVLIESIKELKAEINELKGS